MINRPAAVLAVLFLVLSAGCIADDVSRSSVSKIEILADGTDEIVAVTGTSDIQHICENLLSLKLVKMEYTTPTLRDYTLKFYDADGVLLESLDISVEGWISYDGYFHYVKEGELDREFIAELMGIALSAGPKK